MLESDTDHVSGQRNGHAPATTTAVDNRAARCKLALIDDWPWRPNPDYTRLMRTLKGEGDPQHVPFLELGFDLEVVSFVLGEPALGRHWTDQSGGEVDLDLVNKMLDQSIRFRYLLGYDVCQTGIALPLPDLFTQQSTDTAGLVRDQRHWVDEKRGVITSWEDFERYPWPDPSHANPYLLEYVTAHLPEGMAIIAGVRGVLEPVMWLMGYETFAMALYDQPDLVQALFDRIEELVIPTAQMSAEADHVVALWMGDDMGFKTGPLISPEHLRQYVLPIHRRVAELAHEHGRLFLLHACGNVEAVMEDLIVDVGIDAKHSFEDAIQPVEAFAARYGQRIGVIGGIDMDLMSRGNEEDVRSRVRHVLETCAPMGSYVLGSGNTIANYVPPRNFLAMLDEGWRYNRGSH